MAETEEWTYTFDDNEMKMLGICAKDSLLTPETAECIIEDMAERTGMTQAQAGSVMFASLSHFMSDDDCFKLFLQDYCKTLLGED